MGTNTRLVHVTYEVHAQIHADFLLRVSVYVSALGLQGFGMSLDPGLRHTRTGLPQPQDVRRVWCDFSHSPTDPGTHTGHTTHTVV